MELGDRVVASVLGLALGDALGAPFESLRSSAVPDPLPALELPWRGLQPGSITDDTAMARNLVRSLAERGGFDPSDLVRRHLLWFASNPPGVGAMTGRVLRRVARGEEAEAASRGIWEQRGPEVSASNGSVMYCAPLGLAYANRPGLLFGLGPVLSGLTHFDGRCKTAVLAITLAVASLARGEPAQAAIGGSLEAVRELEGGEELEYLVGAAGSARPIDGPDQGFCLFTAGVALQATLREGSFEDELRRVVGLGGDTDTNAAVTGALLGARDGRHGLPGDWLEKLQDRVVIEAEAGALVELAETV